MKNAIFAAIAALGLLAGAAPAHAITCVRGVYRAGCAGPNGAAVVRKPAYYPPRPYVHPYHPARPPMAGCAVGVYRAGCAGPNGAAVVRRPY